MSIRFVFLFLSVLALLFITTAESVWCQKLKVTPPKAVLINDLAASHPAAPYLQQSTMVVAEIDWQAIDADAFFLLLQKLTGDRLGDAQLAKQVIAKLKDAEAGKIYVVTDLQTFGDGVPLIVITTPKPKLLLKSIEQTLGPVPPSIATELKDAALLIGTAVQMQQIKLAAPAHRDELLLPLRDARRLDQTAVLAIPKLTRSMLARIWPDRGPDGFPASAIPSQLAEGVRRCVVTMRMPPDPLLRVRLDTIDSTAADRVANAFADMKNRFSVILSDVTIRRDDSQITLEADAEAFEHLAEAAQLSRESKRKAKLKKTLKQLGLAFHNYQDREKHLPPRCFVDPDGRPLHSWLVAVLPDFNQKALYRELRLDRAWNDPANDRIKHTVPLGIGDSSLPVAHTTIRAPVFPGSLWHGNGPPRKLDQITDEKSNTIVLADAPAAASIHWADPAPWVLSEDDLMQDFFGDRDSVHVLLADGAVLLLERSKMDNEKLKAMLTIAGGER